ncbi:MAG: DUF5682 family protein [Rhodocyclaceae bacterium]
MDACFHLFGIRHHGPGCARSLLDALERLQPDCLLVEGPPEGEPMLVHLMDADLQPPVALLVYDPDDAQEAAFYPFAEFSPEWQALRHALGRGITARFIDLPLSHQFALARAQREATKAEAEAKAATSATPEAAQVDADPPADPPATEDVSHDPLDWLGRAAGHADGESWWNHMVEERTDSLELFAAIREAMSTVRAEAPARPRTPDAAAREALREAHMRKCMRQAQKEGFTRIAVVCGAWHVPALADMPTAKTDNDLLKALPKCKVTATWAPWSNHKLSFASGYGAGVAAPGWYEHLWRSPDAQQRAIGWMARAARLFRDEDIDCSSAHLIEAVRLAESLAALRERPQAGLDELGEALRTVVCLGDDAPMRLIERRLVIGERLGRIPAAAPAVPLQRDIEHQQKSLRLKPEASQRSLDLDLRQANDLARSHLLHRLHLLGIDWGEPTRAARAAKGTFHEIWTLQWQPEFALAIIEASRWGNDVAHAATAKAIDRARRADHLPALAELIQQVLLCDLQAAIAPVTHALHDRAAQAADVPQLLAAIPPLTRTARYGNVRQTDVAMVEAVLHGLVPRAAIGLAGACASLDDDAARQMRDAITQAHASIRLLDDQALSADWLAALRQIAALDSCHGRVRGVAARLRFDEHADDAETSATRMSLALSVANDPAMAAAWLEGFLNDSAMVLLHDDTLWGLVSAWMDALTEAHFMRVLPLLRRTFATFGAPERRQIGERARRRGGPAQAVR